MGILALLVFCLLAIVAVVLLINLIRSRHLNVPSKQFSDSSDSNDELSSAVLKLVSGLLPWNHISLADLSTDWNANWSRWGKSLKATGTIPSQKNPKQGAHVAFALHIKGIFNPEGELYACNTSNAFRFLLTIKGVEVSVDGSFFGLIRSDGMLQDASGQLIGKALRPSGTPAILSLGSLKILRDKREQSYTLLLGEKIIGQIANPPIQLFNAIRIKKKIFMPAAIPAPGIADYELLWLSCLAIYQVAGLNLIESVWTNSN